MRLALTGRHVDITPALQRLAERKVAKLDRLLNDGIVSAQVVLTLQKHRHLVDIRAHARGDHVLHGSQAAADCAPTDGGTMATERQTPSVAPPRSYPNSSDSSNCSGSAAQLS